METWIETLSRLAEAHRSLYSRARATECSCADTALSLGAALDLHHTLMSFVPESARAVLDDGVVEKIDADGGAIAENLSHLAALKASEPSSSEIEPLAAALLKRVQAHLDLYDRAVVRPLSRFYLEQSGR